MLQAADMDYYGRCIGVTCLDKVRSDAFHEVMEGVSKRRKGSDGRGTTAGVHGR